MKKPTYENILFDLDGTLTDSQEGIINSIFAALDALGINISKHKNLIGFIGIPLQELFLKHFGIPEKNLESAVYHFREYYEKKGVYENNLYPGVIELLHSLSKSSKLFLATSKLEKNALIVLEHFKIHGYFSGISGADAKGTHAGKTHLVLKLIKDFNLKIGSSTVMIGDKNMDIQAANECAIDSIGVTYGYGTFDEIKSGNPTYIVNSVIALKKLLNG